MSSKVTTERTIDPAISLASGYQIGTTDRRYIDDQNRGTQRHVVESLIRGQTRSYFRLSAGSGALATGDAFCADAGVASTEDDPTTAVRTVTRATTGALAAANGLVLGIATSAASPGADFSGITSGLVGRAITGLAISAPGAVKITNARCVVASLTIGDSQIGYVDAAGNLSISTSVIGVTPSAGTTGGALLPAKAASTANVASLSGATTLDGISVVADDRVLLTAQTTASQNGPWIVKTGVWIRPGDFDADAEVISGQVIAVALGATYGGKQFMLTSVGPFVLDTTSLVWSLIGSGGGTTTGGDISVHYVIDPTVTNHGHTGTTAVDGTTLTAGSSRILDTSHATAASRGIWLANAGAWTRPADYDSDGDVAAALTADVRVTLGASRGGSRWQQTAGTTIAGSKTFEYLPFQIATPVRNGYFSSGAHTQLDTTWTQLVRIKPSGDATGVTDRAAVNTALAAGHCVLLSPGAFYQDDTAINLTAKYGQSLRGTGARVTSWTYVGGRKAGQFAMFEFSSSIQGAITDIEVYTGLADIGFRGTITPSQPTGVNLKRLNVYGRASSLIDATSTVNHTPLAGASATMAGTSTTLYPVGSRVVVISRGSRAQMSGVVTSASGDLVFTIDDARDVPATTSATSLTPSLASKTVTGTSTTPYPLNSRVILQSRGSSAWMTGLVTSSSGDLVFTADAIAGSGAHTDWDIYGGHADWDIRRPSVGMYISGAECIVQHCWFALLERAVHLQGSFGCVVQECWFAAGSMYGTPYFAGGTASNCKFKVVAEWSFNDWANTVELNQTIGCKIDFDTGDGGGTGPLITLTGDNATDITGVLWSISGDPLIKANGSQVPSVHNCFVDTAGSALVDFGHGSFNDSPAIYGNFYYGSVGLGAYTGTAISGQYYLEDSSGKPELKDVVVSTLVANTSISTPAATFTGTYAGSIEFDGWHIDGILYTKRADRIMTNGATNFDLFCASSYIEIVGPNAAFELCGLVPENSGHVTLFHVGVAQDLTIRHQSGLETTPARKLWCPGSRDLFAPAGPDVWFYAIWDNTYWRIIPWLGFELRKLNQDLAFSAALATVTGETKTVTLTGVIGGDTVQCNARAALPDGVTMQAWVSAANTVSVRMFNNSLGVADLSAVRLDFTAEQF